jgi:hypothetical protein
VDIDIATYTRVCKVCHPIRDTHIKGPFVLKANHYDGQIDKLSIFHRNYLQFESKLRQILSINGKVKP